MQGKNDLDVRNQQKKCYQNDELFFLGFEKSLKNVGQCNLCETYESPEYLL